MPDAVVAWLPTEVAVLVLIVGIGALAWLVLHRGRDERFAGQVPGLEPVDIVASTERLPWAGLPPTAVEFAPQAGIRPAEWGVLLTEKVTVAHITATIVDLAVRGHLRLERIEHPRRLRRAQIDWVIHRSAHAAATDELADYERTLIATLLRSSDSVRASSLSEGFVGSLVPVRRELYSRMSERDWFVAQPDQARAAWVSRGRWILALGLIVTVGLAILSRWWPIALAVAGVGLALTLAARWMPARTAKGHASKVRAEGFALYLRTAEVEQISAEERLGLFSRYLPFAIVLGAATHWSSVFGDSIAAGLALNGGLDWLTVADVGLQGVDLLPGLGGELVSGLSSGISDAVGGMAGLGDGGVTDGFDVALDGLSNVLDGLDLLP
jgi:hypothetical protein